MDASEDAQDAAALARFAKRYAIGKWREFRGMTAAQVAAAAQTTPAHISKIESGKGEPSVALLKKLTRVLRVDMEALVGCTADCAAGPWRA